MSFGGLFNLVILDMLVLKKNYFFIKMGYKMNN
jgi:hypothetical protein